MPASHDNQDSPGAFEVLQGEDLRRYRAWRKRQREVLKFPACPKCGSNNQVWINQISGTLKCHRAECYVDISAAESAVKLADLLDDSWPHSRAQVEQAAALMRVLTNELEALKRAISEAEPVARLLTWSGPSHYQIPHGGIAARTFAEYPEEAAAEKAAFWKNGAPLYTLKGIK
jgi:hypothetical protein